VYISHKLEELMEIGDTVSVLRDGRMVASAEAADVDVNWIIEKMTGRRWEAPEHRAVLADLPALLQVTNLRVPGAVHDVSFDVSAGEVVGIYGLMGAGRTELLEALAGARFIRRTGSGWRASRWMVCLCGSESGADWRWCRRTGRGWAGADVHAGAEHDPG